MTPLLGRSAIVAAFANQLVVLGALWPHVHIVIPRATVATNQATAALDTVARTNQATVAVNQEATAAPMATITATINTWTGGDCDWEAHLTVVCYGGAISGMSDRTFVTGSTISTRKTKRESAAANEGQLLSHETVHTRQWVIFGMVGFPILYSTEVLQTAGDNCQNIFEMSAGLHGGGYKCEC